MSAPKPGCSWFCGTCRDCGYPVVVTEAASSDNDYRWYCSRHECERHTPDERGDQEEVPWVLPPPRGEAAI